MYNEIANEQLEKRKAKVRIYSLPWINREIRKLMNKQYKQLRKAQTTNSAVDWKLYKDLRNEVHRKLKKAESMYYLETLENIRNGSTDFWNLIEKINKNKTITKKTGPIKNEVGTLIFDDTEANTLNQFFSTIGENHASNQEENVNPLSYICRVTPVIDVDFPVEAFSRKLKSVNPKKAHGADSWSAKEIKIAGIIWTDIRNAENMNSFKLALKKKSRLMETNSYIKGQCNNLNRRTEDLIYY